MTEIESNVVSIGTHAKKTEEDEIKIKRRDELTEVLNGLKGRIDSFEIKGLAVIALSNDPQNDSVFTSEAMLSNLTSTVGYLEFLKLTLMMPEEEK